MAISQILNQGTLLGASGGTTAAVDTSGAKLIVLAGARYTFATGTALSDSAGNTWTLLHSNASGSSHLEWWYCIDPTTSATHTFTWTGSSLNASFAVLAYTSGGAIQYEQKVVYSKYGSTIQPGSLTPANDGSLVIDTQGHTVGNTVSIDSGMSMIYNVAKVPTSYGFAIADLIQATAAAINPLWTDSSFNGYRSAAQAVFFEVPIVRHEPLVIASGILQQLQTPDIIDGIAAVGTDFATDNAIVRVDGTGLNIQESTALVADTGALTLTQDAALETSGAHAPVLSVVDSAGSTWLEFNAQTFALGNLGIGINCVPAITTGTFNFGFGANAGKVLANGHSNVLIGNAAGTDISSGSNNHCVGANAGGDITTGSSNVLFGLSAGRVIVSASYNCAFGHFSLAGATGTGNVASGSNSGRSITTGGYNVFIGTAAGYNASQLSSASSSIAIGVSAYSTKSKQAVLGGTTITETVLRGNVLAGTGVYHAVKRAVKTAAYTIVSETLILANASSAAFSVTLPPATTWVDTVFTIKKTDSSVNAVTVDGSGSETIDGALTQSLPNQYDVIRVVSDGTTWWKV